VALSHKAVDRSGISKITYPGENMKSLKQAEMEGETYMQKPVLPLLPTFVKWRQINFLRMGIARRLAGS
jgi:hypothetical protein